MAPNDEMAILGMGDDDDSAQPQPPTKPPVAGPGPQMISVQIPIDVAQNLMDSIGQELETAQQQSQGPQGAQPPADLTSPGAGISADEQQVQGE